jgi:serine/threonine protein kinase
LTLTAGARLGPYEILSPLGAGGMGEVYKARDTRLERTVAVKVLPTHMASSPEVRQRFEREAKTVSQLSHPHICALYDVGREGETEYLVMELLEGETLSDRLGKGPLPLEQTLRYGTEIADALDKAHRQGIVHRDLKPGNVMITKSGVKLLDFGLAKAMAPATPQSSLTALPTQQGLTREGTILGTFQYMAPEQLEGKEADGRTDIFAFGAVLYEMATGRKAFSGASQASLISAIMQNDPPPISSVQPMSPPALDRVVKKCLAKDPEDRWQNAADLGSELKWIGESGSPRRSLPAARIESGWPGYWPALRCLWLRRRSCVTNAGRRGSQFRCVLPSRCRRSPRCAPCPCRPTGRSSCSSRGIPPARTFSGSGRSIPSPPSRSRARRIRPFRSGRLTADPSGFSRTEDSRGSTPRAALPRRSAMRRSLAAGVGAGRESFCSRPSGAGPGEPGGPPAVSRVRLGRAVDGGDTARPVAR